MSTAHDGSARGPSPERVRRELRQIVDPCTAATGSTLDIVEMGLLEEIAVEDGTVRVAIRLTTPACHMVPYFISEVTERVEPLAGVDVVEVETDDGLTWRPEMMTASAREKRRATLASHEQQLERHEAAGE